jgi:micrococcal nuclease
VDRRPVLAMILAGACTVGSCDADTTTAPAGEASSVLAANAVVRSIVDGDTIDVETNGSEERVRLIGIDTPEIAHPAGGDRPANAAECFGDEARQFTSTMLSVGTSIRLERDVVARDDYGRLLAYVYRAGDGVFVNYELARQGFAQPLHIEPNSRFAPLIVEATTRAESDGAGLWTACRRR